MAFLLKLSLFLIFYKIKQELKLNIHTISRIYWNYYDTASVANYHVDRTEAGYKSIIYSRIVSVNNLKITLKIELNLHST